MVPEAVTVPVTGGQASADGTTGPVDDDISQDGSLVGGRPEPSTG